MVHIKDYLRKGDDLISVAAGEGEMEYGEILKFLKERKPYIHVTLENTVNENAVSAREKIEGIYRSL